jgi:hypothetical protein
MKSLLLKLLAGLTAIAALQLPVGYFLREPDEIAFSHVQRAIAMRADVLLMGDSVMSYSIGGNPVSLLELIGKESPLSLGSFVGVGHTPELQCEALDHVLRQGYTPRLVVISINLRCFGELWDQGLPYQYSELRARLRRGVLLASGLQRPMTSYQIYATLEGYPRSEEQYQNLPITREGRRLGTVRQILERSYHLSTPEARGLAFSVLYQYSLDSKHRKLRALRDIAALCRSKGIPLRFYITPIDVESGERTAGPTFLPRVAANVAVLKSSLGDAAVEDWSRLLPAADFSYQEYPNEHLAGAGRRKLADEVLRLIRSAVPR